MKQYFMLLRGKGMFDGCTSLLEMAQKADKAAFKLREMAADGLLLDGVDVSDDYATIITSSKHLAIKWGMSEDGDA